MTFLEGIVTLLFGVVIGGILAFRFGCWFTRYEMQSKPYTELLRERNQLTELFNTAVQAAEIQFVHHRCVRKPAEQSKPKEQDSFDDWIPG